MVIVILMGGQPGKNVVISLCEEVYFALVGTEGCHNILIEIKNIL